MNGCTGGYAQIEIKDNDQFYVDRQMAVMHD